MQQGFSYEEWQMKAEEMPELDPTIILPNDELFQVTRSMHRETCACLTEQLRAAA
jgi:hypothetical protein